MTSFPSIDALTGCQLDVNGINVKVGEKIASEPHCYIYQALDSHGSTVALKAFKANDEASLQKSIQDYDYQSKASSCPNIVSVITQSIDKSNLISITLLEFCENNLSNYIKAHSETGLKIQQIIEIFQSVANAVHHLHSQQPPIIHRNIKIENILYKHGSWKLGGFGSSTTTTYRNFDGDEVRNTIQKDIARSVSPQIRAPELLDLTKKEPIYYKVDVWQLGCFLYYLCTFQQPFQDLQHIEKVQYTWPERRVIDNNIKSIVQHCFEPDPRKRPSVERIMSLFYDSYPEIINPKWHDNPQDKPFFQMPKNVSNTLPVTRPRRKPIVFDDFKIDPNKEEDLIAAPRKVKFQTITLASGKKRYIPHHHNNSDEITDHKMIDSDPAFDAKSSFAMMKRIHANTANFSKRRELDDQINDLPPEDRLPFVLAPRNTSPSSRKHGLPIPPQKPASPTRPTANSPQINPEQLLHEMKEDHRGLIKKLLEHSDEEMTLSLISLINSSQALGTRFLFKLIHRSENEVARVLRNAPKNQIPEVQAVIDSRKHLAEHYSMFEGNMGLDTYKKKMRENDGYFPPVGDSKSPVSTEAILMIMENLKVTLTLLEKILFPEFAEEGIYSYQCCAYLILKLKMAKKIDDVIINNVIPYLTQAHSILKPMVRKLGDKTFPSLPYNFDDPNSLKYIYCPSYIIPTAAAMNNSPKPLPPK